MEDCLGQGGVHNETNERNEQHEYNEGQAGQTELTKDRCVYPTPILYQLYSRS